ncbi:ATP-binding protein [Aquabacterium sp. A7-Y]|uniref:hybrid sensor histidine kinase/response regulator n=1 Tax=Aquabacterium sp. A7-Y TaxID=1349605 RepID=UPI00223D0D2C|nr:ATP-binding protein [Aquabacterium sp. A7-Y]MCW7537824.1 ATP-binding protein [Aquabacterium sp. A7-Y]
MDVLLEALAEETGVWMGAGGALAGLRTGDAIICHSHWRHGHTHRLEQRWGPEQGLAGHVLVHRRPYHAPDTQADPHAETALYARLGVASALAMPVIEAGGELLGVLEVHDKQNGQAFDEADRERLAALARLAAVAIRNALSWGRLRQVEEQLLEADRRKNEFLATLAHELRNPLAPIRHALQIMQLAGNKPQMLETTRAVMERQVLQLVRLVEDLLDVSRISTGRIELRREWVDLASSVHDAVESVRPHMVQRGHRLRVSLPDDPVYLDADPTRLAQVFTNLLSNASKFTPVGGRISLTARTERGSVVVTIADTGRGIAPEALQRVFDPFTRIDQLLDRSESGLGVGLSLARTLVELHGGQVEASSQGPGLGAQFTVRLPLSSTQPGPAASSQRDTAGGAAAQRVLLVDDNPDTVSTLASLLAMMGHEVKTASGGQEALETGPGFLPDVVLLDIGMPGMDGYETARRVRDTHWGKDTALVAATGWGQDEDKQRAYAAGFNAHMTKPIDPDELERLLDGLQGRGAEAALHDRRQR